MIIKCGWCQKEMGEKGDLEDKRTTHGICPECSEKEKKEIEEWAEMKKKKDGEKPMEPKFPIK